MSRYVIRRLLLAVPTVLGASIFIFVVVRLLPGNVALYILGDQATSEAVQNLQRHLGLDKPLVVQYFDWASRMIRLDLGSSLLNGRPVIEYLQRSVGVTLNLAVYTFLISLFMALPLGVLSAIHRGSAVDRILQVVSIGGLSIPTFWLGLMMLLALALLFGWTPPLEYVSPFKDPWENLQQMFWPAMTLGYFEVAALARLVRSSMLEVLNDDYVRTARSKGLKERVVIIRHALANALLPVVTLAGAQFARLLGGVIVIETVFNLPGLGSLLVQGVLSRNYPIVQASVVVASFAVIVVNLCVDLLYTVLDPRVRYG